MNPPGKCRTRSIPPIASGRDPEPTSTAATAEKALQYGDWVAFTSRLADSRERRRGAALAWRRLGAQTRKEVLEFARRGKLHPNPAVRTVATAWSESNRENVGRRFTAIMVMGVIGVFWARMFGVPWLVAVLVAGCLMCGMLVNAVLLFGRLNRVSADPGATIASEAETAAIGAVPGVRLGWMRRAAAITIGLLLGFPFMLVGLIGAVNGQGSRVLDAAVGVAGAGLFLVGLRAIRDQRQVGRQPREG